MLITLHLFSVLGVLLISSNSPTESQYMGDDEGGIDKKLVQLEENVTKARVTRDKAEKDLDEIEGDENRACTQENIDAANKLAESECNLENELNKLADYLSDIF